MLTQRCAAFSIYKPAPARRKLIAGLQRSVRSPYNCSAERLALLRIDVVEHWGTEVLAAAHMRPIAGGPHPAADQIMPSMAPGAASCARAARCGLCATPRQRRRPERPRPTHRRRARRRRSGHRHHHGRAHPPRSSSLSPVPVIVSTTAAATAGSTAAAAASASVPSPRLTRLCGRHRRRLAGVHTAERGPHSGQRPTKHACRRHGSICTGAARQTALEGASGDPGRTHPMLLTATLRRGLANRDPASSGHSGASYNATRRSTRRAWCLPG